MRPIKIEETIIMPPVILPSSTSRAPKPSISDCSDTLKNLVNAVTTAVFSLACACSCKNLPCNLYHRAIKLGSMPMASITSALRRLLVAKLPAAIAMLPASNIGFFDTTSFT